MKFEQYLSEYLQVKLDNKGSLEDNGLDSLKLVELYVYLCEEYPKSNLSLEELFALKTMDDLIEFEQTLRTRNGI